MRIETSLNTKDRILISAIKVFVERGKYGARMHEIADKAEVNKAMLYYYFTDKDTLYEASFEYILTNLFLKIKDVIEEDSPALGKINRFVNIYIDFIAENIKITRLMAREMADGAPVVKKIMKKLSQKGSFFIPLRLKSIIDKAKENGEIRDVDTKQIIISIFGMSIIYFLGKPVLNTMWDIKPEEEENFIKERKESIIDLIVNGLKV